MKTMNVSLSVFSPLTDAELINNSGGGFAYDVGRCARFLGILMTNPPTLGGAIAIADWCCTTVLNKE